MNIIIVDAVASLRLNIESHFVEQNGYNIALSTESLEEAMAYLSHSSADLVIIVPNVLELSDAPAYKAVEMSKPPSHTKKAVGKLNANGPMNTTM